MIEWLKTTPLYPLFLRVRTRRLTNDKIRTQLRKRAHNLDKQNAEGRPGGFYLFEVALLLKEMGRRGLAPDDTARWAWGVVYAAYFRERFATEDAAPEARPDAAEVVQAIRSRRSVRRWTDAPVDLALVEAAVDAAKWAPSSCNRQPWLFVVLTRPDDVAFMARFAAQGFYAKAPVVIVALIDRSVYGDNEGHFAHLDLGAAIENLLLALHAAGLGACWVGFKRGGDYDVHGRAFRERFGVGGAFEPESLIAVGHPATPPQPPLRKDTSAILKVPE